MSTIADTSTPSRAARLLRFVPATAQRVLDCACGDGALGLALKEVPGRWVAGWERDPACAAIAQGHLDEVAVGDPYRAAPPWPDASFDCAVCPGLLPLLRDPAPMLASIFRLLKPGGLFIADAPNIQYYESFLMLARGRWQLGTSLALAPDNIRFFTAFELTKLLQVTGYGEIRCGVLDSAPDTDFPLNPDGYVVLDDLKIGPMTPDHHKTFLAREYILLGVKSA